MAGDGAPAARPWGDPAVTREVGACSAVLPGYSGSSSRPRETPRSLKHQGWWAPRHFAPQPSEQLWVELSRGEPGSASPQELELTPRESALALSAGSA